MLSAVKQGDILINKNHKEKHDYVLLTEHYNQHNATSQTVSYYIHSQCTLKFLEELDMWDVIIQHLKTTKKITKHN